MARKNLVAQAVTGRPEVFKRFRDWMCKRNGSYDYSVTGLGWTLHDSSYAVSQDTLTANDYFVMYSAGESGDDDLYFKVLYGTSGNIQVSMFQYWNNSTHVGVNGMTAVNNFVVTESGSGTLYIYANMDSCLIFTIFSTVMNPCLFGLLDQPLYDKTVATCPSSVSTGSNVVVAMDVVPSSWVVGGRVIIRDDANMERIIISNISGLNVTFTNIVANYNAGCKFSKDFPVVCSNTTNVTGAYKVMFGHDNAKMANITSVPMPAAPGTSGDPDTLDGEYLATPYEFYDVTTGYYGTFSWFLSMSSSGFTHLNVYTTSGGDNYRAVVSLTSSGYALILEV